MEFVETRRFMKRRPKRMNDAEQRTMEETLSENPLAGTKESQTGGFRKLRVVKEGGGKSGGLRIVYFLRAKSNQILLWDLFKKGEKDSLTKEEKNIMKKAASALK